MSGRKKATTGMVIGIGLNSSSGGELKLYLDRKRNMEKQVATRSQGALYSVNPGTPTGIYFAFIAIHIQHVITKNVFQSKVYPPHNT